MTSPKQAQVSPAQPATKVEQPLYTLSTRVFPKKVEVNADIANPGRTHARWLPGLCIATHEPADDRLPRVVIITRKTSAHALKEASEWGNKWLSRSAAALCWVVFGSYVIGGRGLVGRALDAVVPGSSAWEYVALLSLLAVLLITASLLGAKRSWLASLYVVFFPFTAFFVLVAQTFDVLGLTAALLGTLGRLLLRGANWVLLIVACVAVNRDVPGWLVPVLLAYLVLGAAYIVLTNFLWVTNPLATLLALSDWVIRLINDGLGNRASELDAMFAQYRSSVGGARDSVRSDVIKKLDGLVDLFKAAEFVADKVRAAAGRVVLFYVFCARFLGAVLMIVVVFGAAYRAVARIDPAAFVGTTMPRYWDGVYYSIVTFFTVGDGSIAPHSTLAQAIVVTQVAFAVMTLTVLLLSFSTVSVEVAEQNGTYIATHARTFMDSVRDILGRHIDVTKVSPRDLVDALKKDFDVHIVK